LTRPSARHGRPRRLAVALAVVLAGCTSTVTPPASTPAPVAQFTPTPAPTPSPSPTPVRTSPAEALASPAGPLPSGMCQIPDLIGRSITADGAGMAWRDAGFWGGLNRQGDLLNDWAIGIQSPPFSDGTDECETELRISPVPPTPTPQPTPDPNGPPEPTAAELAAACDSGAAIPEAAPYGGTTHPNIRTVQTGDLWQFFVRTGEAGDGSSSLEYYPGVLYSNGLEPAQLVVCHFAAVEGDQRSCGTYTSPDGTQTLDVSVLRMSETIRVVVAQTGKTLEEKTFEGSLNCPYDAAQSITKSYPDSDAMNAWVRALTKTDLGSIAVPAW
jgi:hypothetical protein